MIARLANIAFLNAWKGWINYPRTHILIALNTKNNLNQLYFGHGYKIILRLITLIGFFCLFSVGLIMNCVSYLIRT